MITQKIPHIPWQQAGELEEAAFFFRTIDTVHDRAMGPVRSLAMEIRDRLEILSPRIEALCGLTCLRCGDICCRRATIWYDFKDLVYLHFSGGGLPGEQIQKIRDGEGQGRGCIQLTGRGCRLPRSKRPFVCTWYLCPDQKQVNPSVFSLIARKLSEIKNMRYEMEAVFCRVSSGGNAEK